MRETFFNSRKISHSFSTSSEISEIFEFTNKIYIAHISEETKSVKVLELLVLFPVSYRNK